MSQIFFSYLKLNSSQNEQSILLLCHDNPPEVSRIARFCTNFIFEKKSGEDQDRLRITLVFLHKIFENLINTQSHGIKKLDKACL